MLTAALEPEAAPPVSARMADPILAEHVAPLGENLSRLLRVFNRARSQFLAAARHDVEWSAHVLTSQLVNEGPLRVGALAECVRSDASTVSRQVAAMVRDGLIERHADPVDGRASLLVATDKARRLHAEHNQVRNAHFARMLEHWSVEDCQQFSTLLARFTEDFERLAPRFPTEHPDAEALPRTAAVPTPLPAFSNEES